MAVGARAVHGGVSEKRPRHDKRGARKGVEGARLTCTTTSLMLGLAGWGRTVAPAPTFLASALAASFSLAQ